MDARLATVKQRIALLAAIDPERQIFGADTHRYQLLPPLSDAELGAVERRLGVTLPEEVRDFLRQVGASGAGPYYGLRSPEPFEYASVLRPFPFESPGDSMADGALPQDGTVVLADQGCGYASLLVLNGPHRGEVWSDFTYGEGPVQPESPSFIAWYEAWIERALIEWIDRVAPRLALDGPECPEELEAAMLVFDVLDKLTDRTAVQERALGYLHLREGRYEDADAALVRARDGRDEISQLSDNERDARLHRDRANLAYARDDYDKAIREARAGLSIDDTWYSTSDELREILERALHAAGRSDEALQILDERAAQSFFDFSLHHRLATERLARGDVSGAALALERAASMAHIAGHGATLEQRVSRSFSPIINALRAGGRGADADALESHADLILYAN